MLNLTPDGLGAGLWQGGVAPAADASGDVYLMTGNSFGVTQGIDYGISLVKLSTPNNLAVVDYFSPMSARPIECAMTTISDQVAQY